jgi:hypothetical protein
MALGSALRRHPSLAVPGVPSPMGWVLRPPLYRGCCRPRAAHPSQRLHARIQAGWGDGTWQITSYQLTIRDGSTRRDPDQRRDQSIRHRVQRLRRPVLDLPTSSPFYPEVDFPKTEREFAWFSDGSHPEEVALTTEGDGFGHRRGRHRICGDARRQQRWRAHEPRQKRRENAAPPRRFDIGRCWRADGPTRADR